MKKRVFLMGLILLCAIGLILLWVWLRSDNLHGGTTVKQIKGLRDNILSHDLVSFSYQAQKDSGANDTGKACERAFSVSCEQIADGRVHIVFSSEDPSRQDSSQFLLDYEADEDGFLSVLDALARDHALSKENGRIVHVNGLPPLGDTLKVQYASGEEIYKSSNQTRTLSPDAAEAIFDAFLSFSSKNGQDLDS